VAIVAAACIFCEICVFLKAHLTASLDHDLDIALGVLGESDFIAVFLVQTFGRF